MILSDLAATPWFQGNLATLLRTSHTDHPQVKHALALMTSSKFKECSEICEAWVLTPEFMKSMWRSGSPTEWIAEAYSFATTVAVVTGAIPQELPKDMAHG